jgi:ABC-type hemin transport system ATPase subunit
MWEKNTQGSHTLIRTLKKNLDFFEEKKLTGLIQKKPPVSEEKKSHSHIHSHTKIQFSFSFRNLVQIFGRVPSANATSSATSSYWLSRSESSQ